MPVIFLAIASYSAAVLQTSLAPSIEVRHVMPDLFALLAIVWLLRGGGPRSFVAAGLIGLAFDLTSSAALGIGLGLFSLTGYLVAWLRSKLDGNHLPVQLAIVWLATTVIALGEAAAGRLLGETMLAGTTLAARAVGVGAYTTGIALPLLMVLGWLPQEARGRGQGAGGMGHG